MCVIGHKVREWNVSDNINPEREARILDAAQTLVLHYGYDKTTVSDIANEAGISKGAIYLHFNSKEELFEALIWREVQRYIDAITEALETDDEEWSFIHMYSQALKITAGSELLTALVGSDMRVFGSFLQRRSNSLVNMKRPYTRSLLEGMQQIGALRQDIDVTAVAVILSALNYGIIVRDQFLNEAENLPIERVSMALGDMLQRALLPEDGGNPTGVKQLYLDMLKAFKNIGSYQELLTLQKQAQQPEEQQE